MDMFIWIMIKLRYFKLLIYFFIFRWIFFIEFLLLFKEDKFLILKDLKCILGKMEF